MAAVQSYLLLTILLLSLMKYSQALSQMSADESNADVEEARRDYDLDKLRRYLLTAKAEERAAKREQQDLLKRQLIREYFQASGDSDSQRFQEVRKRLCASFDEFYATQAACLG